MTPPPCPRCAAPRVLIRDALGRAIGLRCRACDVVPVANATQPASPILQTPGALKLEQRDPLVTVPVVADEPAWNVPATRRPYAPRADLPCVVCGAMVPQAPTGPISRECDACCPPGTLASRKSRRAAMAKQEALRAAAAEATRGQRDALGFPLDPRDLRTLVRRSGGAA